MTQRLEPNAARPGLAIGVTDAMWMTDTECRRVIAGRSDRGPNADARRQYTEPRSPPGAGAVWVVDSGDNEVVRIDPEHAEE